MQKAAFLNGKLESSLCGQFNNSYRSQSLRRTLAAKPVHRQQRYIKHVGYIPFTLFNKNTLTKTDMVKKKGSDQQSNFNLVLANF